MISANEFMSNIPEKKEYTKLPTRKIGRKYLKFVNIIDSGVLSI